MHQLGHRTGIDRDGAAQLQMIGHPLLARLLLGHVGDQTGADRLTRRQPQQHVGLASPGNHGRRARTRRTLGGQNLGDHAARAHAAARTTGHGFQRGVARPRHVHKRRRWVLARVGGVQPTLIGQDDEQISLDQVGHQRAQRVVVAKLDFVVDDGVVFVDDRHHPQPQQRQQRRAGVQVPLAVGQVGVRQQHLRAAHAVGAQLRLVHLGQPHLPYRGRRLQLVHFFGARGPAQALHALGDRPAADHDDLAAVAHQGRELAAPLADGLRVQATPLVGDQAGAHLDDDAAGRAQHLLWGPLRQREPRGGRVRLRRVRAGVGNGHGFGGGGGRHHRGGQTRANGEAAVNDPWREYDGNLRRENAGRRRAPGSARRPGDGRRSADRPRPAAPALRAARPDTRTP